MTLAQANGSSKVRFGPFEANLLTQELRNGGKRIRVPAQSFQVLQTLLNHPGELVTREQLRSLLWPLDTFVDFEHGLNAAVNRLRDALHDSAGRPRWIETLPRRGRGRMISVPVMLPPFECHKGRYPYKNKEATKWFMKRAGGCGEVAVSTRAVLT